MYLKIKQGIKNVLDSLSNSREAKRHSLVGNSSLWKMKRDFQYQFLLERGLLPEMKLIDIGCGTLRGGIPLINYLARGNYFGIESRANVLAEAWKEVDEQGLGSKNPVLLKSDDKKFPKLSDKADMALAFSVVIHMSDEIVESLFGWLDSNFKNGGKFYANVNYGNQQRGTWQGFPVNDRPKEFYEALAKSYSFNTSVIGNLRELGHNSGRPEQDEQEMLCFEKIKQ